ncbi:MAG: hypothetical protein CVU44_11395 [Chloroflexi bacterium HGW-Chloroflexi-6]|nr:MAG: hypothetical protein CVU44_11395 [Chloroflexi bacterium HGW-Chloroflexi-6]
MSERLAFRTSPHGFQAASLGDGRFYHLNCVPLVTGAVVDRIVPGMITFCPDGWPANARHAGFMANAEQFEPVPDGAIVSIGKITDSMGRC